MKKFLIIIIFLFCMSKVNAQTTNQEVSFVRCVDGDTAVFLVNEEEIKFRFLAIDTPETVHPNKEDEFYGMNASDYTCEKLTNAKQIIVEYEESNKIDKYDRHLAWIWVDGVLLQEELIKNGFAFVAYIYGQYRYTESLCYIQNNAYQEKVGLWQEKQDIGYCSTIDLSNIQSNIDFDNIDYQEELSNNKLYEALDKTDKVVENANELFEKHSEKYIYVFFIIAAIVALYKEFKK